MNKKRILALAELIEKQPHTTVEAEAGFTMDNWTHDCGTPACIAGWACHVKNGSGYLVKDDPSNEAAEFLGLNYRDAEKLFEPEIPGWEEVTTFASDFWGEISPQKASAVLRHLAETGKVDWSIGGAA